ncbi:MAG: endonuclease/exonuclease/phosphatase family protein [Nitrospiraceae bacterium]
MKVATFNVNSLRKRIPIVLEWLQRHQPDVLCLQETKVQDSEFPLMALAPSGYEITYRGMKSYNGVAVLTRTKPDAVFYGFDDGGDTEEARLMRWSAEFRSSILIFRKDSKSIRRSINISSDGTTVYVAISIDISLRRSRRSGVET